MLFRYGILVHQQLHRRRGRRGRVRGVRIEGPVVGREGLLERFVHGRLAGVVIKDIAAAVGDLADARDKGNRAVPTVGGHGEYLAVGRGREPEARGNRQRSAGQAEGELRVGGDRQVDALPSGDRELGFARSVGGQAVREGMACRRHAVLEQGRRKVQRLGMSVPDGHNAPVPGGLCPDRVERDRRGHLRVEIIRRGGDVLPRRVASPGIRRVRRPAQEGDPLRRGIDGIWIRTGGSLTAVHSHLADLPVTVPVVAVLHLRRPDAAVHVKAHQQLLRKGDGGVRNAVAELALYFKARSIIDPQNGRVSGFMEGRFVMDGIVVAVRRSLALYGIILFISHAGFVHDFQQSRLSGFDPVQRSPSSAVLRYQNLIVPRVVYAVHLCAIADIDLYVCKI